MKKIAVYGAGAWGTALAICWANAGHAVTLVPRDANTASKLAQDRLNAKYLPRAAFPESLRIAEEVPDAPDWLVFGVPTVGLAHSLARLAGFRNVPAIIVCKGFVGDSAELPTQLVGQHWHAPHGVVSGPSFARELAAGLPAAVMLASANASFANETAHALSHAVLRIYPTTDVIGVEIGGAVKNVLAIAAGLCDGLALGGNARAALITRGLAEATRLAVAMGGKTETLAGLAGMGDLVLTCTGDLSRNRRVGLGLAQGRGLTAILNELGQVAEGVPSARKTVQLAQTHAIKMPICEAVAELLDGKTTAKQAVQSLMTRAIPRA